MREQVEDITGEQLAARLSETLKESAIDGAPVMDVAYAYGMGYQSASSTRAWLLSYLSRPTYKSPDAYRSGYADAACDRPSVIVCAKQVTATTKQYDPASIQHYDENDMALEEQENMPRVAMPHEPRR